MNTTTPVHPPGGRSTRWLRTALIVSLAFNMLVIGTIATAAWRFAMHDRGLRHGGPSGMSLVGFLSNIPSERRSILLSAIAPEREALRPLRSKLRTARSSVRGALVSDPFDPERLAKAQSALLAAEIDMRRAAGALVAKLAVSLTPAERSAFSEWDRQRLHRRDRWRSRGAGFDAEVDENETAPKRH